MSSDDAGEGVPLVPTAQAEPAPETPEQHRIAVVHEIKWVIVAFVTLLVVGGTLAILIVVLPEAVRFPVI
jgi:hypothetical protein